MQKRIFSGQLREKIKIQRRSSVSDGAGNFVSDWADLYTGIPARVVPLRGGESIISAKLHGTAIVEVHVRYSSDMASVTTDDRIVDERSGVSYNIRLIENQDERRRYLSFMAERGVNDG